MKINQNNIIDLNKSDMAYRKFSINPYLHAEDKATPHKTKYQALQKARERSVRITPSNFPTQKEAVDNSVELNEQIGRLNIRQNLDGSWRNQMRNLQPVQWLPDVNTSEVTSGNIRGRINNELLQIRYIPSSLPGYQAQEQQMLLP